MRFSDWFRRGCAPRSRLSPPALLRVEALEARVVPYSVSGNAWPVPQKITLSFVPDGTLITANGGGYVYSNLFAKLNTLWPTASWQWQFKLAAQQWAEQTNINFVVVTDNGTGSGGGSYQQGDPGMGDIRISGYNFGSSDLAGAFLPPPINNFSLAGDIELNTDEAWSIGGSPPGGYDLFTVIQHEIGHALGLGHSGVYNAQMYGTYTGIKWALNADDIAGIRTIYSANGPRSKDYWDAWSDNGTFATAQDFTVFINPSTLAFSAGGLDLTTLGDSDFYRFTVPSGFSGTLGVKVQSQGLSQLSPTVTVYNASQTQIGYASGAGQYGTTLNLSVSGLTVGQPIYIRVGQSEFSTFGMGAYSFALNFGTGPMPDLPPPNTQRLNGSPPSVGGLQPEGTAEHDQGHQVDGKDLFPASETHDETTLDPSSPNRGAGSTPERTQVLASLFQANPARGLTVLANVAPTQTLAETTPRAVMLLPLLPVPSLALGLFPRAKDDPIAHVRSDEPAEALLTLEEPASPGESDAVPSGPEEPRAAQGAVTRWRQASEAWFATEVQRTVTLGIEDLAPVATTEEPGSGQDALTFLAASGLVVSGVWGRPPQQRERRRGQRT